MPTLPVDHGCEAAHSTALTTSACSPGRPSRGSRSSRRSRAGRPSRTCSRAPSASRPRRSRGSGPTGPSTGRPGRTVVPSTGPAGPVWPEWLKYGPIERITGVFAVAGRFFGPQDVGVQLHAVGRRDRGLRSRWRRRARRRRSRRRAERRGGEDGEQQGWVGVSWPTATHARRIFLRLGHAPRSASYASSPPSCSCPARWPSSSPRCCSATPRSRRGRSPSSAGLVLAFGLGHDRLDGRAVRRRRARHARALGPAASGSSSAAPTATSATR